MESRYWQKYNLNKNKLIKKIASYNKKNKVNFFESGHYNHIRDILALLISTIDKKNKRLDVLDYGSNLLSLVNFINKIDVKKINFNIYDPYYKPGKKKNSNINIRHKIIDSEKKIFKKNYNLVHFGSSIQYENNFFDKIKRFKLNSVKYILITHTPFSLKKHYFSRQTNHPNLIQNIYSLSKIVSSFKKYNYKLIFKSRNSDKYIACKNKKFKTYSLNLLFKK
tara:strand:+ start:350 stop:1018 length:669 start_codon:yes stop_codon:yes gene_type:complete